MVKLKKREAFQRMIELFGPWGGWGRSEHLAYGLIRGVPYAKMERCSNDNPPTHEVTCELAKLGAIQDFDPGPPPPDPRTKQLNMKIEPGWWKKAATYRWSHTIPREFADEIRQLIVWVKKEPKARREAA